MAHHNSPIVINATSFPSVVASNLKARPTMLCDETIDVVKEVAKALVRKGLRADVLALADSECLTQQVRAVLRSACLRHGTVH